MSRKEYKHLDRIPAGLANEHITEGCLVVEGGAFRGLYNEGVMDAWMRHGLNFSCVIGVSAGALAGMNTVSGQIGRSARANLSSRYNKNYIGTGAVRKSHSMIRLDYLFKDYNEIEPFNEARFNSGLQRYVAVAANCLTGEAEYFENGVCGDIYAAMKASASMPYITPMVDVEGKPYLDGGCACKIPYRWALDEGYDKIVIIKTRERGYRKKVSDKKTAARFYKDYPAFAESLDNSNADYNKQCDEIDELEKTGRAFVIAPSEPVTVSRVERNLNKLGHLYWLGYEDALAQMDALKAYMKK